MLRPIEFRERLETIKSCCLPARVRIDLLKGLLAVSPIPPSTPICKANASLQTTNDLSLSQLEDSQIIEDIEQMILAAKKKKIGLMLEMEIAEEDIIDMDKVLATKKQLYQKAKWQIDRHMLKIDLEARNSTPKQSRQHYLNKSLGTVANFLGFSSW